ncbi:MAG: CARDB domain-containing protein [bacterium]|nr:CARDB domain-containing protein [bacterium]
MTHYAHRFTSWFAPRSVAIAIVALAAAFFVALAVPPAHAQAQRPDLKITSAKFDGVNLHVEYVNATGVYDRRRYEVGFRWVNASRVFIGDRHWLPVPEVERGGVAILDASRRISLSYYRRDGIYSKSLAQFLAERPDQAVELRVILDDGDRIPEEQETNNIAELRIPYPDLEITGAKFVTPTRLEFTYRNTVPTPIRESFRVGFAWTDDRGTALTSTRWMSVAEPATGTPATIDTGRTSVSFLYENGRQGSERLAWYLEQRPAKATQLRITMDDVGTVTESNERNNAAVLRVGPPPQPDLSIRDASFVNGRLTFTAANTGVGPAVGPISFWFEWINADGERELGPFWFDVPRDVAADGSLRVDSKSLRVWGMTLRGSGRIEEHAAVNILGEPPGDVTHLKVRVDGPNKIAETNESNNVSVIAIPPQPKPDLQIPDLIVDPVAPRAGERVWFTVRVENVGSATTGQPTATGLILDNDVASKKLIGQFTTETIPSGKSATLQWKKGNYYGWVAVEGTHTIDACADRAEVVAETDETNNCTRKEVRVSAPLPPPPPKLPDLTITKATLDTAALRFQYHNRGDGEARPEVSFWYEWVDAAGQRVSELRWINVGGMGPRTTSEGNQLLDVADLDGERGKMFLGKFVANAPESATHLKLTIDGPNAHAEANEQNNSVLLPKLVQQKPDLTLRDAALSREKLKVTIVNVGKGTADRVMWQFRWLGAGDTALATSDLEAAVGKLEAGASYPVELPIANARAFGIFRFLQDMPDGAVALEIAVDPKYAITESDEQNNATRIELVGPDLALGAVEARDGAFSIGVKNLGTRDAKATDIWLAWFGTKGALPSSAAVDLPAIAAGKDVSVTISLDGKTEASRILRDPPKDGTKLRVFLDGSRRVEELNEQNNDRMIDRAKLPTATAPIVAKLPDLVVRDLVITPERPQWNTVVSFTARVENVGEASVGRPTATWLNLLRPRDGAMAIPMERQPTTPDLAPGASAVARWEGEKYWTIQQGEHEVIVCAESMGYVHESNEQNNCARKKFTVSSSVPVKPAKPDLVIQGVTFTPTNPEPGDILTVTAVIRNAGTVAAPASVAWFTPNAESEDGDASAIPTPQDVPALAPGASTTVTWEEAWAAETGTETFEVCADAEEAIAESNEANNCKAVKMIVSARSFLQRVAGFPLRVVLDVFSTPIRAGTE